MTKYEIIFAHFIIVRNEKGNIIARLTSQLTVANPSNVYFILSILEYKLSNKGILSTPGIAGYIQVLVRTGSLNNKLIKEEWVLIHMLTLPLFSVLRPHVTLAF